MFKIGDFSKLSRVSIKALRLYDQIGLLKPVQIDQFTSYRYYSASQLPKLNRILALKDLGFSLEQISKLLDEQIPPAQIRGMLRLKQAELQQHIETEQRRLARVEARLKQIEQEDIMSNYDVIVKKIEPITVVSIRDILPSYLEIEPITVVAMRESLPNYLAVERLFNELFSYLLQHGAKLGKYCAAIWHDPDYKESNIDGEAVIVIESPLPDNERVKVYQLPGWETMACTVHHGCYKTINLAYNCLLAWIEANNYKIVGSNREFYIHSGSEQDNESYVTEIQFPIEKA